MSDQRDEQRGHFGSSPCARTVLPVLNQRGEMAVPPWAQDRPPTGRPATLFDPPRGRGRSGSRGRGPGSKRIDAVSPRRDRTKLGKTSGLFAAGAWSAREEIARLIESGVPSSEILEAIRSGSEGDQPLELQGEVEGLERPAAKSQSVRRETTGEFPDGSS